MLPSQISSSQINSNPTDIDLNHELELFYAALLLGSRPEPLVSELNPIIHKQVIDTYLSDFSLLMDVEGQNSKIIFL
jgi:hypothetical protein